MLHDLLDMVWLGNLNDLHRAWNLHVLHNLVHGCLHHLLDDAGTALGDLLLALRIRLVCSCLDCPKSIAGRHLGQVQIVLVGPPVLGTCCRAQAIHEYLLASRP